MRAVLSSKVFEMAHSLHLVMGLVNHTKQFFLYVFFCCTIPLQTPDSKWTAMRRDI